jgi:hypothetical protein
VILLIVFLFLLRGGDESAHEITDIFLHNTHLSFDTLYACVCVLCLALQLKIYYIFIYHGMAAAESSQNLRAQIFIENNKKFSFRLGKRATHTRQARWS